MKKEIDLKNDPLFPLCLKLSLPTAISQAVQVLYSIVDRMYIGHIEIIGSEALAAVGIASPLTSLVSSFSVLIGLGGSPIMAMKLGAGDKKGASDVLNTALYLLILLSLILFPIFYFFRVPLLSAFGATEANIAYAEEYLRYYLYGTPFVIIANGLAFYLINQGESRKAMVAVLSATLANIVLDPIFIFTFSLGVKGAAIASVISQALQAFLTLFFIVKKAKLLRLKIKKVDGVKRITAKIVKFGLSPFIIIATDSLLMILLNTMLKIYGKENADLLITSSAIIQSFHLLVMNPLGGITAGCQGLLSYNYGANDKKRVKKAAAIVQLYAVVYASLMLLILLLFKEDLVLLFTTDSLVVETSAKYLVIFEAMIIPIAFQYSNVDAFTALGEVRYSLPLSLGRKTIFFISLITLPSIFGAESAFLSEPIADLTSGIVSTILFYTSLNRILERRRSI